MTRRLRVRFPLVAPLGVALLSVSLLADCATSRGHRPGQLLVAGRSRARPTPSAAAASPGITPVPPEVQSPSVPAVGPGDLAEGREARPASVPIVRAPGMLRPASGPIVGLPALLRHGPISGPAAAGVDATTVRRRFVTTYRDMARARLGGLLAARRLARFAAKARHRTQALRALARFRRALQTAFRIGYAARRRTYAKVRRVGGPAASAAWAALNKPGQVTVNETVGGPPAAAFTRATSALLELARTGAPLIGTGVALWTGRLRGVFRAWVIRFQRMVARAASALEDLARALR